MNRIAFFFIVFLLIFNCAYSQSTQDFSNRKIDGITGKVGNNIGAGYAIAIIRNNTVIFKKGYGKANLEYNIPISTQSVFDAASLAKQFTGFAISTLIQQGRIKLSDDISKYLPQVPNFGAPITIENLVHHTSGIRDWPEALQAAGWRYDELCSFEDILNMVKNQKDLDFEPGNSFSYSNTGYNLLAAIVEKVSGQTFPKWTQENIFKPLNMTSSRFLNDKSFIIHNEAYPYSPDQQGGFLKLQNVLTAYGSSSLYTNIDDLCKWVIHLQNGISLNEPVYKLMLEVGVLKNGNNTNYGFGLEIGQYQNLQTISHTGAWSGYRSMIKIYPDKKLAYVLLSNGNDDHLISSTQKVLDDFFMPQTNIVANAKSLNQQKLKRINPILLSKYAGKYKWGPGEINITIEDGQLYIQYTGEDKYPTEALSDSSFLWTVAGLPITFSKPIGNQSQSFYFKSIQGKRFVPFSPTLQQLNDYSGTYSSNELFTKYTIDQVNGKLFVHHFRRGDFELYPDTTDTFSSDIGTLSFIKNNIGHVTAFMLSGNKVKNLKFNKDIGIESVNGH